METHDQGGLSEARVDSSAFAEQLESMRSIWLPIENAHIRQRQMLNPMSRLTALKDLASLCSSLLDKTPEYRPLLSFPTNWTTQRERLRINAIFEGDNV